MHSATANSALQNLGNFYVVPFMESSVSKDSTQFDDEHGTSEKILCKWTEEECLRGVNPQRNYFQGATLEAMAAYAKDKKVDVTDRDQWAAGGDLFNMLKHETLQGFLDARGASQNMNISTD